MPWLDLLTQGPTCPESGRGEEVLTCDATHGGRQATRISLRLCDTRKLSRFHGLCAGWASCHHVMCWMGTWAGPNQPFDHVWAKQRNPRRQFCFLSKTSSTAGHFCCAALRVLLPFAVSSCSGRTGKGTRRSTMCLSLLLRCVVVRGGAWTKCLAEWWLPAGRRIFSAWCQSDFAPEPSQDLKGPNCPPPPSFPFHFHLPPIVYAHSFPYIPYLVWNSTVVVLVARLPLRPLAVFKSLDPSDPQSRFPQLATRSSSPKSTRQWQRLQFSHQQKQPGLYLG